MAGFSSARDRLSSRADRIAVARINLALYVPPRWAKFSIKDSRIYRCSLT